MTSAAIGRSRALRIAIATTLVFMCVDASADEGDACVSSYENAQKARKRGDLVRSQAELRLCVNACPDALGRDCRDWLDGVSHDLGHVRVKVRAKDGAPLVHTRVVVDELELPASAERADVKVNPGSHELRVDAQGMKPIARKLEVTSGATVDFDVELERLPPPLPPPPTALGPIPAYPFIVGGIGLAAVTAGGVLGIIGQVDVSAMRAKGGCAPGCPQKRVDRVRNEWISGGVAAGIGGAAVVTSVILLATAHRQPLPVRAGSPTLFIDPLAGVGAVGWVRDF